MFLSGSPEDYNTTQRETIAATFAHEVGVDPAAVTVLVEAASVKLSVVIQMPNASANTAALSILQPQLNNTESASVFVGAPVVLVPTTHAVTAEQVVMAPSPPPPSPP
eukprot:5092907-Prymnesium_polylepis.2